MLSKNEASNKIQIFLQYLREFNQNLEILRNKENIRELSSIVSVLENNILELKNEISNIINKINEINSSLPNEKLQTCSNATNVISSSTKWIPQIGTYISTASSIIGSICKYFS